MTGPEIERRLARVEAHLAIQQLAFRYALAVDSRDLDAWVGCFRPDVDMGRHGSGREALRATSHRCCAPSAGRSTRSAAIASSGRARERATGTVYCRAEHEVGRPLDRHGDLLLRRLRARGRRMVLLPPPRTALVRRRRDGTPAGRRLPRLARPRDNPPCPHSFPTWRPSGATTPPYRTRKGTPLHDAHRVWPARRPWSPAAARASAGASPWPWPPTAPAVAVSGRTEGNSRAVVDEIGSAARRALAVVGDVGSATTSTAWSTRPSGPSGGLDILVNNAQSSVQRPLAETTPEDVELAYRSGPLATFAAMRRPCRTSKRRGGSIVNLGLLRGAHRPARLRLLRDGEGGDPRAHPGRRPGVGPVRHPGQHDLPASRSAPPPAAYFEAHPEQHAKVLSKIPLGRLGDAEQDIGRAVAALVTTRCAYLTGATLVLEGGRTIVH